MTPLKRPVSGLEHGFPFVAIGDTDEVISMSQVDLRIDSRLRGGGGVVAASQWLDDWFRTIISHDNYKLIGSIPPPAQISHLPNLSFRPHLTVPH